MQHVRLIAVFVIASAVAFGVLHFAGNVFGVLGVVIAAAGMYLLVTTLGKQAKIAEERKKDDEPI